MCETRVTIFDLLQKKRHNTLSENLEKNDHEKTRSEKKSSDSRHLEVKLTCIFLSSRDNEILFVEISFHKREISSLRILRNGAFFFLEDKRKKKREKSSVERGRLVCMMIIKKYLRCERKRYYEMSIISMLIVVRFD